MQKSIAAFLQDARSALAWAYALHSEFIRVFWQFPERAGLSPEQADEWRTAAQQILGWLPDDSPYVKITELERQLRESAAVVPDSDDTPEAREVRAATELAQQAILQLRRNLLKQQQQYRDAGWLRADIGDSGLAV